MSKEKKSKQAEIEVKDLKEAQEKLAELRKDSSLNKPSEQEINDAIKDFNEKASAFNGKRFTIGSVEKSDVILNFMLEFMEKHVYWTKQGWMGVIRMVEELEQFKKDKKADEPFGVGYQALEFMFYALTNPGGTGLSTAKALNDLSEIYGEVLELSGKTVEDARIELKDIQFLQDKVTAMQQGFYLEREDGVQKEEEFAFASPTTEDLING